jgi:hypothetical protein
MRWLEIMMSSMLKYGGKDVPPYYIMLSLMLCSYIY